MTFVQSHVPAGAQAQGNANYILIPNQQTGPYQSGKVTIIVTEDIVGIDQTFHVSALDFQLNYFTQSGMWMQTILEPSLDQAIFRSNEFQQWAVKAPYSQGEDYQYVGMQIGSPWSSGVLKAGSILELYWNSRIQNIPTLEDWYCGIRQPSGIYDGFLLDPSQFGSWISPGDLLLNYNTEAGGPGQVNGETCEHVFSISGIGGGSFFQATSGAGKIAYSGLHPDPLGNLAIQTAESSNFHYSELTLDDFGNYVQEFSL